jgi:predicted alpha/beta hydrolase family esterase
VIEYFRMNKQNVILLHGRWPETIDGQLIKNIPLCDPNNSGNWMGWVKKQLEENGYDVACPVIADAHEVPYEQWKIELDKENIGDNTVLVGWSAGGYALLRYLGESGKQVKKVILVAPGSRSTATDEDPLPTKNEFYSFEILPSLKEQISDGVTIVVSNDSPEILESVEMYKEVLNTKVVELEGLGHFSFLIPQLPKLLEEILN